MPVTVRKTVRNSKGEVIEEYEGTEAEVEAYEKKKDKKEQSEAKQKEKRLLLESQKTLDKLTKKDLLDLIEKILAAKTQTVEHHWYHYNGYWWKPYWDFGRWTYIYTQQNPLLGGTYTTNTCADLQSLSKSTGLSTAAVYSSMLAGDAQSAISGQTIDQNDLGNLWNGSYSSATGPKWKITSGPVSNYHLQVGDQAPVASLDSNNKSITSGIVNLNIKS